MNETPSRGGVPDIGEARHAPFPDRSAVLRLSLPVALITISLLLLNDTSFSALRYDRAAIVHGEWWRLVTCHVTHLGPTHFLLNAGALVAIWSVVGERFAPLQWWLIAALCLVFTGAGLFVFYPAIAWYTGLSGVLHGLFVAGLLSGAGDSRLDRLLLIAVGAKLLWEQTVGPLPGSEALIGDHVVVEAHLCGALSAAPIVLVVSLLRNGGENTRR